MKKLIFALFFLIFACNSNEVKLKEFNFYEKSISVPNNFIIDSSKSNPNSCGNNLFLKDREGDTSISFELCSYRTGKRQSFKKLNSFFKEEFAALEEELIGLEWIDKEMLDKNEYYEFMYEYKQDEKYYRAIYFTYEKYFVVAKITDKNKSQFELTNSINFLRDNNFLDDVIVSKNELENFCLNCNFPTFW